MGLSQSARAKIVTTAGAGAVTAGIYGSLGWQAAAIGGGAYVIGFGLLFVDVDEPKGDKPRRVIER